MKRHGMKESMIQQREQINCIRSHAPRAVLAGEEYVRKLIIGPCPGSPSYSYIMPVTSQFSLGPREFHFEINPSRP